MEWGVPLFIFVVTWFIFGTFLSSRKRGRDNAQHVAADTAPDNPEGIEARLMNKARDVMAVSLPEIPGKTVKEVLGMVSAVSQPAHTPENFVYGEQCTLLALMEKAASMGANAILNVRLTSGTYEINGSQWQCGHLVYTGTAVVTE